MKFNGENLVEVLDAHERWIKSGGQNEEDRADFSGANLRYAFLSGFNLYGADFRGANLYMSSFYRSCLNRADFTGANTWQADFFHASLRGTINPPYILRNIPDTGSFIAWKRVKLRAIREGYDNSAIAKLMIPEDAKRDALHNGECRASKVIVLEIQDLEGNTLNGVSGLSPLDLTTKYTPGETVTADNYGSDLYDNMIPGIYFYLQRDAAVRYLTEGFDQDSNVMELDYSRWKEQGYIPGVGTPHDVLLKRRELQDLEDPKK